MLISRDIRARKRAFGRKRNADSAPLYEALFNFCGF